MAQKCQFWPGNPDIFGWEGYFFLYYSYFHGTAGTKIEKSMTSLVPSVVPVACGSLVGFLFTLSFFLELLIFFTPEKVLLVHVLKRVRMVTLYQNTLCAH